jgi:hypothetical protein
MVLRLEPRPRGGFEAKTACRPIIKAMTSIHCVFELSTTSHYSTSTFTCVRGHFDRVEDLLFHVDGPAAQGSHSLASTLTQLLPAALKSKEGEAIGHSTFSSMPTTQCTERKEGKVELDQDNIDNNIDIDHDMEQHSLCLSPSTPPPLP